MCFCSKCKNEKPDIEFNWRNKAKGKRCSYCKVCSAEYDQLRWKKPERRANKIKEAANQKNRNCKYIWNYLAKNNCPCGENNPILLEFDHRDGVDKRGNLSELAQRGISIAALDIEIAKCDVLCVRCHRLKTAKQFGWYKYLDASELTCYFR